MTALIYEKFNLQKAGFKNLVLLILMIVVLGLIGIIAKAIAKGNTDFSGLGQTAIKTLNISEAQAQCWVAPSSCASCASCASCTSTDAQTSPSEGGGCVAEGDSSGCEGSW